MANNRMPRKGGPRGFAGGQKVDGKAFARLMRMLFHDYPGKLTAVVICIALNAVIGITPTIFVKTITSYIETGLTTGWDAILPKMDPVGRPDGRALRRERRLRRDLYTADGACDAGLFAQHPHAHVLPDADAPHPLL